MLFNNNLLLIRPRNIHCDQLRESGTDGAALLQVPACGYERFFALLTWFAAEQLGQSIG